MKTITTLAFILTLFVSKAISATTIRFSEASPEKSPDSVEMQVEGHEQILQVNKEAILTDKDIQKATAFKDTNGFGISIQLLPDSNKRFSDLLPALYRKQLAIIINDKLVSAPVILLEHTNGQLQITGNFSEQEATQIASDLCKGEQGAAANP